MNTPFDQPEFLRIIAEKFDGFNQSDAEALYSLFADHARIEDPVDGG